MAIDSVGAGFNPHLLSDQSPVNSAISALVLPSSFRPVPDPESPSGSRWEMDTNLLLSAEVTSTRPFTVTYTIRPEAAWTDNAPIAADDYWYLWRQMVSQPGVVDPAGYDLITGVQSVNGGKTAVVTFSQSYPAWRELFNDLLPAHLVKDVPGGFSAGLVRALPVTGGQFRVDTIDPQRDEILLARNDRFWGTPARPDQILFRRAGAPAALADSIRNGDTQVAQVHGGAAAFAQLSAIPDVRTARITTPRVLQLTLRGQQPTLSDPLVRKGILGLLDVELLAAVAAGSDNSVTLDQSLVRAPSDPGYEATAPEPVGTERALEFLAEAGYQVERAAGPEAGPHSGPQSDPHGAPQAGASRTGGPQAGGPQSGGHSTTTAQVPPVAPPGSATPASPEPTRGRISRNGQRLTLVIGAAANDPISVAVANTAADQLRNVGVAATVAALDPPVLYGSALAGNRIDAIVGWHAAGGDLATALSSRFGCPALESAPVPTTPPSADGAPARPGPTAPTRPGAAPDAAPLVRAPSNLTGVCDRGIQAQIDAALNGSRPVEEVLAAVEPKLWAMSTVLPIMQDTTIVAAGPTVKNVALSGAVPVGIVGDAGTWVKTAQ